MEKTQAPDVLPGKKTAKSPPSRADRLADALRANLRRRKQQESARQTAGAQNQPLPNAREK